MCVWGGGKGDARVFARSGAVIVSVGCVGCLWLLTWRCGQVD